MANVWRSMSPAPRLEDVYIGLQDTMWALSGATGHGLPLILNRYNGTLFAVDIQSQESGSGNTLRARSQNGTYGITLNNAGLTLVGSPTLVGFTAGSVLFVGSGRQLAENNPKLYWDNTNAFLGIGTTTPLVTADVVGSGLGIRSASAGNLGFFLEPDASGNLMIVNVAGATVQRLDQNTGNLSLTPSWTTGVQDAFTVNAIGTGAASTSTLLKLQFGTVNKLTLDRNGNLQSAGQIASVLGAQTGANVPNYTGSVTWNQATTQFIASYLTVSDTTSAVSSLLQRFDVGGTPMYSIGKTGLLTITGQIAFPATQNPSSDPNTLDDYEEGTWTPTLSGATTTTYTTQTGTYTKIGRQVWIKCILTINAVGDGSTTTIAGLPYTPSANAAISVSGWGLSVSAMTSLMANVNTSGNIVLHGVTAATASSGTIAVFQNGTTVTVAGSYEV